MSGDHVQGASDGERRDGGAVVEVGEVGAGPTRDEDRKTGDDDGQQPSRSQQRKERHGKHPEHERQHGLR